MYATAGVAVVAMGIIQQYAPLLYVFVLDCLLITASLVAYGNYYMI